MDQEEFLRVWDENANQLQYRILKIVRNSDSAEDVLQEVFLRAYPHIQRFDGGAAKYLMRTATNIALDYLHHKKRWNMDYPVPDQVCETTPYDSYQRRERQELLSSLASAINDLPSRQREAIFACSLASSRHEAAQVLGIPYTTLRARERKAIDNVRRKIRRGWNLTAMKKRSALPALG